MKKIKNICLMIICLFIIGISYNVKADTIKYYLSTAGLNYNYVSKDNVKESNVKRGDYITVTAVIDYSDGSETYRFDKGKLTLRWDNKYLKFVDYDTNNSNFSGISLKSVSKEASKIVISEISAGESIKSGKSILAEFKFQVLENSNTGSTRIYQMDGEDKLTFVKNSDDTSIEIDSQYSELKYNILKSSNNKLSSIKLDGREVANFDENTNSYSINVGANIDKINIEATPKDNSAKISGIGEKKLNYGLNKIAITVTSESDTKNVYNINITREDNRSGINTLKTLVLSTGEINFRPNINEYTVNVENDVEEITITSSLTDSKSKYIDDYSNKKVKLTEGSNKIQIKVVSEKGEENTYILNINRALSTNNSLKSLKVNDEKIELKEDEFTYSVDVENDVDSVIIKAIANDSNAMVELKDKYELQVGENEINILVIAASGDKATYTINVNRKKILSKDSLLKSLKITNYNINFKPDVTLYTLEVKKEDSELEIVYETEDENAKVDIEGNKDLEDGSIIKINVHAEDGSFKGYFINIEKPSNETSPVIIIILILLLLLGICLAIIFIRKKKQKERKEFKELNKDEKKDEVLEKSSPVNNNLNEELPSKEASSLPNEEVSSEPIKEDNALKVEEKDIENDSNKAGDVIEKGAHEYVGEHERIDNNEALIRALNVPESEKKDTE